MAPIACRATADDCPCTASGQCGATESCQNGAVVCMGNPVAQESCNCADDDCDGTVDEGSLCGTGATCTNCQCAFACSPGEFPCPMGKTCLEQLLHRGSVLQQRLPGCPGRQADLPAAGLEPLGARVRVGVRSLDHHVQRAEHLLHPDRRVQADDCTTFPDMCAANQNCIAGTCVTNLCQGVTCQAAEYCVAGQCFGSCANVDCPLGERCRLGMCEADPCGAPCPAGQVCNDASGSCVAEPVSVRDLSAGPVLQRRTTGGMCEDDPCVGDDLPRRERGLHRRHLLRPDRVPARRGRRDPRHHRWRWWLQHERR